LKSILANINPDYAAGSSLRHLDGLETFATAEVDNHFPGNPLDNVVTQ
jgi:hypothetical protein